MAKAEEAAFVERITAGATHELRNVLAIVKEAAGLIEDLLHAGAEPGSLDRDKVLWAVTRIELQVGRGTALVGALNRFAHSLGGSAEPVALSRLVEHAALLGQRAVRQHDVELEVRQVEGASTSTGDPLRTFMVLVAGMEECAMQVPAGGRVIVGAESRGGGPAVRFTGEEGAGKPVAVRGGGAALAQRLGEIGLAPVPLIEEEGPQGFLFVFPVGRV